MFHRLTIGIGTTGIATITGWQQQIEWHFRMASLTVGILAGLATAIAAAWTVWEKYKAAKKAK